MALDKHTTWAAAATDRSARLHRSRAKVAEVAPPSGLGARVRRRATSWGRPAIGFLVCALLWSCGDDDKPAEGTSAPMDRAELLRDPNLGNPDRGQLLVLSDEPFHPEWVGGNLALCEGSAPKSLNNLLGDTKVRNIMKHYLVPFLLEERPDVTESGFVTRPAACVALPVQHDDRVTYTWTLRDDLSWSDGKPLRASDYEFTWGLMQDPEIPCDVRRGTLSFVRSVKATGDLTFDVTFDKPHYNAANLFGLEFTVVPAHAVPRDPTAFRSLEQHVGFGPYEVLAYSSDRLRMGLRQEYRSRPFPIWPCYVEELEFRYVPDDGQRLELLRQGAVDIGIVPGAQFAAMEKDRAFQNHNWLTAYDLPNYEFVGWNSRDPRNLDAVHPILGDPRVRRALTGVVDRDHIVAQVRGGFARKVNGPHWFRDADYDESVANIPYDPVAARRTLEGLGWSLNDQGFLERDGAVFRLELIIIDSELWRKPAEVVRDGARRAGVDIQVTGLSGAAFMSRLGSRDFDCFYVRNGLNPPIEPDQFELFHSSQARSGGNAWAGLADPRVDRLLEEIQQTFDPRKRLAFRRQFHHLFDELHPFTVVCASQSTVGVSRRWSNVWVHDLGIWYRDLVLRDLRKP